MRRFLFTPISLVVMGVALGTLLLGQYVIAAMLVTTLLLGGFLGTGLSRLQLKWQYRRAEQSRTPAHHQLRWVVDVRCPNESAFSVPGTPLLLHVSYVQEKFGKTYFIFRQDMTAYTEARLVPGVPHQSSVELFLAVAHGKHVRHFKFGSRVIYTNGEVHELEDALRKVQRVGAFKEAMSTSAVATDEELTKLTGQLRDARSLEG